MGLVLKKTWLRKGTGWVEKDTMKASFTKVCPHCLSSVKLGSRNILKTKIRCPECLEDSSLSYSKKMWFVYFSIGFWAVITFKQNHLATAIVVGSSFIGYLLFSQLKVLSNRKKNFLTNFITEISMLLLSASLNSILYLLFYYLVKN